ncbi:MAG: polyprenyl synthetase family protein [Candidatus Hydrogenedentota bacterium]|nr:MAG: polyprenyl synthetase family protein [Candidatus Hydrogenedentota bacterium]
MNFIPSDFSKQLTILKQNFESQFRDILNQTSLAKSPPLLKEAIEYSLFPGKRVRAILALKSADHAKLAKDKAFKMAAAVECIHAYSLIHDDLPAMDNDTLRRGKPTSHIRFGEATAILAGDALQALAFEFVAFNSNACKMLAVASGASGLVGGQLLDMQGSAQDPAWLLKEIEQKKTGALMAAAVAMPFAAESHELTQQVYEWGENLGVLFQMADDILDETASTEDLGKSAGKDKEQNKITVISVYGLNAAKEKAENVAESLSQQAKTLFADDLFFVQIPYFILRRQQ